MQGPSGPLNVQNLTSDIDNIASKMGVRGSQWVDSN
jgi:hypothetical protein